MVLLSDLNNLVLDKEYKFYYTAYNDKNEKVILQKRDYIYIYKAKKFKKKYYRM